MNTLHFLLLVPVVLVSCNAPDGCVEASRTAVTDPSTALLIGGTYADALAAVGGMRSGPLQWLENEDHVTGFPPPGQAEITVTILEPDTAWNVDLERGPGVGRYERLFCPDVLEADLEIELQSDDGVLDARILAPTTFQRTSTATIVVDVTDEDLGMLEWSPVVEGASLSLWLSYGTATGDEGSLRLRRSESDDSGQGGVGTTVDLARWTVQ
jgi:hypothetical protein